MKILGISLDGFGDQVLRQPLLTRLLDDGHDVALAVRVGCRDIVPFIDPRLRVLACDVGIDTIDDAPCGASLATQLGEGYDVVAALAFNRGARDDAILAGFDPAARLAFADAGVATFDPIGPAARGVPAPVARTVPVAKESLETAKNAALYRALSGTATLLPSPRLLLPSDTRKRASAYLESLALERDRYVVMAGLRRSSPKAMPFAMAVDTIAWLWQRHGLATLLAGTPDEAGDLQAIHAAATEAGGQCRIHVGETGSVDTLLVLLDAAHAYVGGDTGTMHFAGALGRPVAAIVGGGHFPRFQPSAERWFAITKRLLCFGCAWNCVYGSPRCLREVTAPNWQAGIAELLAGGSPGWRHEPGSIDDETAVRAAPEVATLVGRILAIECSRSEQAAALDGLARAHRAQDASLGEAMARIGAADADVATLTHRVRELADALAAVEVDRAQRLELIERLTSTNRALASSADEAHKRIAAADEHVATLTRTVRELEGALAVIEADRAARLAIVERLDVANQTLGASLAEVDGLARQRQDAIDTLARAVGTLEVERDALAGRVHEVERTRALVQQALDAATSENAQLRSARGAMKSLASALRNPRRG